MGGLVGGGAEEGECEGWSVGWVGRWTVSGCLEMPSYEHRV